MLVLVFSIVEAIFAVIGFLVVAFVTGSFVLDWWQRRTPVVAVKERKRVN